MPPRISRGSLPAEKSSKNVSSRKPAKSRKRALNAFSIASYEQPEHHRIRETRLGESDFATHKKRPHNEDEEEEGEEGETSGKRVKRLRDKANSSDEGSDSDGNTWQVGHVDEDDDSDIDSDEAFGESDEEKFEGWAFRGSSGNGGRGPTRKGNRSKQRAGDNDIDLSEEGDESEDEEDDFGEDAIDLATALDQYESEEDKKDGKKPTKMSTLEASASELSDISSDENEGDEEDRQAQLHNLISTLAADDEVKTGPRRAETHESSAPSEFAINRKIDFSKLKLGNLEAEKKRALKLLQDDKPSKRNDIARKLEVPLPKRQQDKLDRAAASAKANETLDRWIDTVKHTRRAEHLSFPLDEPKIGTRMGEKRLLPTTAEAPTNRLESTIQSILQQSGLSSGKDDEEQLQKWEELQTNKMPLEEVLKRRAQLRQERELLFREEIRARRIKKIKSKAYRKVHRKEREKLLQRERDALKADGVDVSEDEQDYNDRRRAEERMGAKHRDSKWAKGVKASGRAAWDEDARSGVTEMARRNEELRRRIEGKGVQDENEIASDFSSEAEDEEGDEGTKRQLDRLMENPFSAKESKLANMAFMQKADAARKAQNDEDVKRMRKELAGEESNSEDEDDNAARRGRRKFGPGTEAAIPGRSFEQSEFEEQVPDSSNEEVQSQTDVVTKKSTTTLKPQRQSKPQQVIKRRTAEETDTVSKDVPNPYLVKARKDKNSKANVELIPPKSLQTITPSPNQRKSKAKPERNNESSSHGLAGNPTLSLPDADGFQTITYTPDSESDAEADNDDDPSLTRNHSLTAIAFATDFESTAASFAAEKLLASSIDTPSTSPAPLPGWGSWTDSTALSQPTANHTSSSSSSAAHKAAAADANPRVLVNTRRIRANTKYLAPQLPFPFETKAQYERSLRLPQGREWTTKRAHQGAVRPRVVVRQGTVVRPLGRPLV